MVIGYNLSHGRELSENGWYVNHSKIFRTMKKMKKKNVESRYLYKINNITVKLLFLSFFCVRLICLLSLKTLCLFSDSVNCTYHLWAWVTFYRLHSDKVDHCSEALLSALDNSSFKLLFLFPFVSFTATFEKR